MGSHNSRTDCQVTASAIALGADPLTVRMQVYIDRSNKEPAYRMSICGCEPKVAGVARLPA